VKCANSRFLNQYRVPWCEVCNCESPIWFTVMSLKYLCNIKALNYIENKFRCYFHLLFIQYNVAWQYQSMANLSLPYQYTSQGKMATSGLDELCWILSWVSNFLSTVITMMAPRPTLTPIQWMLFYSPWGSSSHILYKATHFHLASNFKKSGAYYHGPSELYFGVVVCRRAMLSGSLSPRHGVSSGCGWRNGLGYEG
jgi:hypothetical protein